MSLKINCFLLCSLIPLIFLCVCAPDTLNPLEPEVHSWPLLWGYTAAHAWTEPAGTARCCLSHTPGLLDCIEFSQNPLLAGCGSQGQGLVFSGADACCSITHCLDAFSPEGARGLGFLITSLSLCYISDPPSSQRLSQGRK